MTQHKPVLTDAEIHILISGNLLPVGLILDRLESFARNVEQSVLKKLAEQEPVATVSQETFSSNGTSDIITNNLPVGVKLYAHPIPTIEQEPIGYLHANGISFLSSRRTTAEQAQADDYNTPLYTHPMPCLSQTQDKTAADMYWINPDYPSYESILEAFEPISSSVEIKVGDRYEVSSAKMLPMMTVEVSELEENGDVKEYRVISTDAPKHDGGSHD